MRATEPRVLSFFVAESPMYFAGLLAVVFSSSIWQEHPVIVTSFGGLLAAAAYWRVVLAHAAKSGYERDPMLWEGRIRRSIYATVAIWSAFGYWLAIEHALGIPDGGYSVYLTVTVALCVPALRSLASIPGLPRDYVWLMTVPIICIQSELALSGVAREGYVLAIVFTALLAYLVIHASPAGQVQGSSDIQTRELPNPLAVRVQMPLNGIAGITALLLETSLTEQQREYLQEAHRSAIQTLEILRDAIDPDHRCVETPLPASAQGHSTGAAQESVELVVTAKD